MESMQALLPFDPSAWTIAKVQQSDALMHSMKDSLQRSLQTFALDSCRRSYLRQIAPLALVNWRILMSSRKHGRAQAEGACLILSTAVSTSRFPWIGRAILPKLAERLARQQVLDKAAHLHVLRMALEVLSAHDQAYPQQAADAAHTQRLDTYAQHHA